MSRTPTTVSGAGYPSEGTPTTFRTRTWSRSSRPALSRSAHAKARRPRSRTTSPSSAERPDLASHEPLHLSLKRRVLWPRGRFLRCPIAAGNEDLNRISRPSEELFSRSAHRKQEHTISSGIRTAEYQRTAKENRPTTGDIRHFDRSCYCYAFSCIGSLLQGRRRLKVVRSSRKLESIVVFCGRNMASCIIVYGIGDGYPPAIWQAQRSSRRRQSDPNMVVKNGFRPHFR